MCAYCRQYAVTTRVSGYHYCFWVAGLHVRACACMHFFLGTCMCFHATCTQLACNCLHATCMYSQFQFLACNLHVLARDLHAIARNLHALACNCLSRRRVQGTRRGRSNPIHYLVVERKCLQVCMRLHANNSLQTCVYFHAFAWKQLPVNLHAFAWKNKCMQTCRQLFACNRMRTSMQSHANLLVRKLKNETVYMIGSAPNKPHRRVQRAWQFFLCSWPPTAVLCCLYFVAPWDVCFCLVHALT